ncbi:hypothetical protein R5R35_010551 [Gryllus longicercus]|uniref:Major facilitator superfamily (MFS) profile domain-containing protein n=1 Tax=Gryllus longicercus TaxID=2509291 RepID=A0AAN9Z0S4_9ORTH
MPVGSALAAWAFGRCADRLGRRFALLACGLVGALAWLLLLCERSSVQWVCASRILVGVQMGAIFTVFPVYVAEIAHVSLCPAAAANGPPEAAKSLPLSPLPADHRQSLLL